VDTLSSPERNTESEQDTERGSARGADAMRPDACAAQASDASPRLVIRGESSGATPRPPQPTLAGAALTDWLNVTFRIAEDTPTEQFFDRFSSVTGDVFGGMTDRERGLHGWNDSFAFDRGNVMFARGGQRGTALLSLPGEGCAFITDWEQLQRYLRDELAAKITRWDGAADDYLGIHSVDLAVELYKIGGFNSGGRQPKPVLHGNWLTPDDLGRTFEVGKRKNGKLARIYEKGKQLGSPLNPWVRWEVELHSIDRHIP
jgi:phage replication initiation protein